MLHSDFCVVRWTFVLRSGPTCIFVPVMRIKPSIYMVLCLSFNIVCSAEWAFVFGCVYMVL